MDYRLTDITFIMPSNSFAMLGSLLCVKIKQVGYYAVLPVVGETPNRTLIHEVFNNISNKTCTPEKNSNDQLKMVKLCWYGSKGILNFHNIYYL